MRRPSAGPLPNLMYCLPVHIFGSFHEPFGKRRMGMDHLGNLYRCGANLHGEGCLMNKIRRMGAEHMDSENSSTGCLSDDFPEASNISCRLRLAQPRITKSTNLEAG